MSDRIFMGATLRVSNQGLCLGQFTVVNDEWVFTLVDPPNMLGEPNRNLHRKYSAPYVVKFVDDQLTMLNVMQRLKS